MNTIEIELGHGKITLDSKEVLDMFLNIERLQESYMILINEKKALQSDIYFSTKKDSIDWAKKHLLNDSSFSSDFISEIFK